jgi:hypothetical protein
MIIEDSLKAPLAGGDPIFFADFVAARGGLRARKEPPIGPGTVVMFPSVRASSRSRAAAPRASAPDRPPAKGFAWRGAVVLLLPALSAALCGWPSPAREPTDAQLIAVIRRYGADRPRPFDPVAGRAVRVMKTATEWVVTLIDPRRLDPPGRRYVGGSRSAYHIDRATLRVVSVVVAR